MTGTIPARERFLAIPSAERDALDLLYLGEFHRDAGRKDAARAALEDLPARFPGAPSAAAAKAALEALEQGRVELGRVVSGAWIPRPA